MKDNDDWFIDTACYEAGMCTSPCDTLLEQIEDAIEDGELTVEEARQLYFDQFIRKECKMKPSSNLLNKVLNQNTLDEKNLMFKATINALTSAVATNIMGHITQQRRGFDGIADVDFDEAVGDRLGAAASQRGEPTIDQRNADDLAKEGKEQSDKMTEEAGNYVPMAPLRIAEICDGIRRTIYDEFRGFNKNLLEEKALYREQKRAPTSRINFAQPMSLELNLNYRIQAAGRVDPAVVKREVEQEQGKVTEEFVRGVLMEHNARRAAGVRQVAAEVLTIAEGFNSFQDESAFESLPIETQIRIATKIGQVVNQEYRRLYGIKLNTGNLDVAARLPLVEECHKTVRSWLNEAEMIAANQGRALT